MQNLLMLDQMWSSSAQARDAEKVGAFCAEDAIAHPPNALAVSGRTAATKVWGTYFAEPSFTISWSTTLAEVAESGDSGYTAGTYAASFKGADGKVMGQAGKFLCVWKRQVDGTWKAYRDMWSPDTK